MTTKNTEIMSPQDFVDWKKNYLRKLSQEEREIVLSILGSNFCKEKCLEAKIKFFKDSLLYGH